MRGLALAAVVVFAGTALADSPRSAVQLRFVTESGAPAKVSGTLRVTDAASDEPENRRFMDAESAIVSGPLGSKRRVSLDAESWWMPPLDVGFESQGMVRQDVVVWKATKLQGRFLAERELPDSLEIFIESPPDPTRPPPIARNTTIVSPLSPDGAWSCRLPAATLDLALRVPGFAPVYAWDTAVPVAGKTLGSIRLKPGASVTAWIDRKISRSLSTPAGAELHVLAVDDASPAAARLRRPVASATFDRNGQVQLIGLRPGDFILRVRAPGFAETAVYPVTVYEGRETAIRKVLELHRPITLELSFVPPLDADRQPWDVELRRANDFGSGYAPQATVRQRSEPSGTLRVPEQSPGRFMVIVRDRLGNKLFNDDIVFGGSADGRRTIDLDTRLVEGTVTFAGEPLEASLWFGGKSGAVRVHTRSGEDGRFSARLPRLDRWLVEIEADDLQVQRVVTPTDDLRIDLPDSVIFGSVTREDGSAVPQAVVQIFSEKNTFSRLADEAGRFRVRGTGRVQVQARDRRTGEASRMVNAEPGRELTLRIEEGRAVEGVVVSQGRPVIGARVSVYGLIDGAGNQSAAVTDADGRFAVTVPAAATTVVAVVGAPGRVLQPFLIDDSRPVALDVAPAGGNLLLRLPEDLAGLNVWYGSVWLPFQDVLNWTLGFGGALEDGVMRAPNLAPGDYRFCATVSGNRPRCRTARITVHGSHEIDLR